MSEKRKYHRISADGRIGGKMVLASEIEILDLSMGGAHFNCTKRVSTNSFCSINIRYEDTTLALKGKVTRSNFKGTASMTSGNAPVYEVGMQFSDLPEDISEPLKTLIELLEK